MRPSSLIILVDDLIAQKLAAAWPCLSKHPKGELSWNEIEEWATLAAVSSDKKAERICQALIAHQICLPDGTIDRMAEGYIAHIAAARIKRKQ